MTEPAVAMENASSRRIVAIGSQDNFAHVYPSERAMLAENDIGGGVGESRFPLEFFDGEGRRLVGVYDGHWRLTRLLPTEQEGDTEALLRRLRRVVENKKETFRRRPDIVALYGLTPEEAIELLAESSGPLDTIVSALDAFAATPGPRAGTRGRENDPGGWLHRLLHH